MIKDSEEVTTVGAVSFLCYKNRKTAGGSGSLLGVPRPSVLFHPLSLFLTFKQIFQAVY